MDIIATADVWSGTDSVSPFFGSSTVRFPTTDVVATVALTANYPWAGETRWNEYPGLVTSAECWVDQNSTPGGYHRWSVDTQLWQRTRSVTFWIVTRRAYAAAVGVVHGDRQSEFGRLRPSLSPRYRAVIDRDTGEVRRLHTDISLGDAEQIGTDELDELLLAGDGGDRLRVVEAQLEPSERFRSLRLDRDRDVVTAAPLERDDEPEAD